MAASDPPPLGDTTEHVGDQSDEGQRTAIADAAKTLDGLRCGWLFPAGMADEDRQKRTLTHLYNENPTWLRNAHEQLDRAVFDAYGWSHPLPAPDVLAQLAGLNAERAALADTLAA